MVGSGPQKYESRALITLHSPSTRILSAYGFCTRGPRCPRSVVRLSTAPVAQYLGAIDKQPTKRRLLHHPDHFYALKMKGDRDGSIQCTPFTKDVTGMFTCAWPDCVSGASRQYCEFWGRPWLECTLPEKEPGRTQGKIFGRWRTKK